VGTPGTRAAAPRRRCPTRWPRRATRRTTTRKRVAADDPRVTEDLGEDHSTLSSLLPSSLQHAPSFHEKTKTKISFAQIWSRMIIAQLNQPRMESLVDPVITRIIELARAQNKARSRALTLGVCKCILTGGEWENKTRGLCVSAAGRVYVRLRCCTYACTRLGNSYRAP